MGAIFSQCFFISEPTLTEKNLPDQTGKVHIVTGGYAGCGEELVKLFYQKNATVYVAGRSQSKADAAIARIKSAVPDSKGKVEFIHLDLADLTTIKAAADTFKAKESRLDTLTNNAGVMSTPPSMKTKQGYELQLGTNCVGPWLFTHHLLPVLQKTAAESPKDSVRVTWAASLAVWVRAELICIDVDMLTFCRSTLTQYRYSPKNGVDIDQKSGAPKIGRMAALNYGQSKAGNVMLASEFAKRYGKDGILSVSWNPGNLRTELQRHTNKIMNAAMSFSLYPAKYGAYTELYAACSPELTAKDGGAFIAPWGRKMEPKKDVANALKEKSEGGTGVAKQFWEWCEKETKEYV